MKSELPIIALVSDLLFSGRISATARAEGIEVRIVRDAKQLDDAPGQFLIVDLNQAGALESAIAWRAKHNAAVVGFVSHVDTQTIARAREAGIDQVLPRSQFVSRLPELLRPSV